MPFKSNRCSLFQLLNPQFLSKLLSETKIVFICRDAFFHFLVKDCIKQQLGTEELRFFLGDQCDSRWREENLEALSLFSGQQHYWILQTSKQWELIKTEKSKGAIDTSSRIFLFASSRPGHELHSQLNDNWSVWTIDPPPAWKSSEVASVFAQKLGVKLTREGVQWVKSQHFEEWSSLWAILQQASLETKNISSELLARLRDKSEHTMFRLADCVNHKDWQTLASLLRETAPSVSARVQEFRFLNSHFTKMLLLESAPGKESLYYKKIRQARKLYSEEEIEEWILRLTEWERLSKIDPPFLTHRLGAELCNLV